MASDSPTSRVFTRAMWRAVSAEFVAMFLFVYIGVGTALTTTGTPDGAAQGAQTTSTLTISLCFGLTIFVLVHIFGHISGAHINPAVTLALMMTKQVDLVKGLLYMAAQFSASIIATPVLMASMGLTPEAMGGYNALTGPDDNEVFRGFVTEVILTFCLVMTVFSAIDPSREATGLGPLAIGMAVAIAHFVAVPITGCGINPARSLGPALWSDVDAAREDVWVFLVAPFVGGSIAALLYPLWFAEENLTGGLKAKLSSPEGNACGPDDALAGSAAMV